MSTTPPAPVRMMQMLSAYWTSQCLIVAAKLRLADHVHGGPKTAEELAKTTGTHAPSLYRMMRALASNGVFAEDEQRRFGQTELSETLRSDLAVTQRPLAILFGDEHYASWGQLEYSVRTGQTAFDKVYGQPCFDWLAEHPEQAANFDAAMVAVHGAESAATCDAYDFSAFGTLVDIGGGNGSLISLVLERFPNLKGVLYDLPHVVERARPKLPPRCAAVGGSFFESVPAGGDAYMMRHIIHDWDEPKCRTILGNVRKVIPPAGKLLVVEGVVPPGNGPSFTKMLDLNMLVIPGGQERTEEEYRELLAKTGFKLTRVVPTRAEVSVIEGVPA